MSVMKQTQYYGTYVKFQTLIFIFTLNESPCTLAAPTYVNQPSNLTPSTDSPPTPSPHPSSSTPPSIVPLENTMPPIVPDIGRSYAKTSDEVLGLIGYDCSSPRSSFTAIALNTVKHCDYPPSFNQPSQFNIQILQLRTHVHAHVRTCRIT